nr:unnamed protein product [Callosobruchus analis]
MTVFRPAALQSVTAINPKKDSQIFISLGTLSSFSVTEIYRKTTDSWSIFDKSCVVSRIIVRNGGFFNFLDNIVPNGGTKQTNNFVLNR